MGYCAQWRKTIYRLCLLAGVCLQTMRPACAAETPVIGVLRPTIDIGDLSDFGKKVDPRLAQEVPEMKQLFQAMAAVHIGTVQSTWVQILELKGIEAVAIDAPTLQEARIEAKQKGAQWLLFSSVTTKTTDIRLLIAALEYLREFLIALAPEASRVAQVDKELEKLTGYTAKGKEVDPSADFGTTMYSVTTEYALQDVDGNTVLPLQKSSHKSPNKNADLWSEGGNDIEKAISDKLPPGPPGGNASKLPLPAAPELGNGAHFRVVTRNRSIVNGKNTSGDPEITQTLDLVRGGIAARMEKQRGIFVPGNDYLYLIDETNRSYVPMRLQDYDGMMNATLSYMSLSEAGTDTRLSLDEQNDKTANYKVIRNPASAENPEVTVEIEFGDKVPSWTDSRETWKNALGTSADLPMLEFGTDTKLSQAIWNEVIARDTFPRRVVIREHTISTKKKKIDYIDETEAVFEGPYPADAAAFIIPSSYQWHSNPGLSMLFTFHPGIMSRFARIVQVISHFVPGIPMP